MIISEGFLQSNLDFFKQNINVEEFDFESFIHSSEKKVKNHVGNILNK